MSHFVGKRRPKTDPQARAKVSAVLKAARDVLGDGAMSDPQVSSWIDRHARTYVDHLSKLRKAVKAGKPNRKSIQNRVLKSHSSRVCAVLFAAAKREMKWSPDQLELTASTVRPWRDCGEPVRGKPEPKSDGSTRWTICYGVKRLALSYLCRDVLDAHWGPMLHEFNRAGMGTESAVNQLKFWVDNDHPWIGTADIKKFFPSIGHEGLIKQLPLPESVIRNSIIVSEDVLILLPDGSDHSAYQALRQGIPQGSPASQLIAARMTQLVLDPIGFDWAVWSYSDNIFWACPYEKHAKGILTALIAAFAAHPAGELKLHKTSVVHSDTGMDLLGYNVRTFDYHEKWWGIARPTTRAFFRWFDRLVENLLEVDDDDLVDQAIDQTLNWIKSRSAWDPTEKSIEKTLDRAIEIANIEIANRAKFGIAA